MTKNGFFKTLRLKAILCLTILCLILSSACMLSACGKNDEDKESISYPSASKIEDDDALVKNGSFEYGSYNLTSSSFPVTSITGWSLATDNNAQASNITSVNKGGVVDKDSWNTTLDKFFDSSSSKTILEKDYDDLTKENYAEKIGFNSDKVFAGDKNKVLMLNAYNSSLGGSAVKATSSNSITLDKDAYYKVSVDVYTANLSYNEEEGANIRLINTINGTSQEVFGIYGINNNAWTTYTMYVKADSELSCSVTLVLGLGRGGENANEIGTTVQGSAFFDNVEIVKLESAPTDYTEKAVAFGSKDSMMQKYDGTTTYLYNMSVKITDNTESFSDQKSGTIGSESYKFISFSLAKEDDSKPMFNKHDIYGATVYILDKDESNEVKNKTEIKKFTYNKDEDYTCKILLKNNFETVNHKYE
ncbi:MAG: hypothetical protein KBS91_01350, partial [Firmicutes bacterium]|nr:hypothetical protein [Candidatus Caballimonas caccae]